MIALAYTYNNITNFLYHSTTYVLTTNYIWHKIFYGMQLIKNTNYNYVLYKNVFDWLKCVLDNWIEHGRKAREIPVSVLGNISSRIFTKFFIVLINYKI